MTVLVKNWQHLKALKLENDKYRVDVDLDTCNGHIIYKKAPESEPFYKHGHYLSTHTFYGSQYKESTKLLQKCGFDVEIDNWDK